MEGIADAIGITICIVFIFIGLVSIPSMFGSTSSSVIIKECTENKILIVKDKIIKCEVLDKKALAIQ